MGNFIGNQVTVEYAPVTKLTAGASLPATTLNVEDTSLLPASGSVTIGANTITYTGKTSTTLTGASGGTGSVVAGDEVLGAYTAMTAYINDTGGEMSVDEGEATKQNAQWKEYLPGLAEGNLSFTVFHEDGTLATQPQYMLEQTLFKMLKWRIRERGTGTGKPERVVKGFLTAINPKMANDSSVVVSEIEIRLTGAPNNAAQS